jgi:hypothetical protein
MNVKYRIARLEEQRVEGGSRVVDLVLATIGLLPANSHHPVPVTGPPEGGLEWLVRASYGGNLPVREARRQDDGPVPAATRPEAFPAAISVVDPSAPPLPCRETVAEHIAADRQWSLDRSEPQGMRADYRSYER